MPTYKEITTKSGHTISESWCRKCASMRPASDFYEAVDCGEIDTLMIMSVCKPCIQKLYDGYNEKYNSMEKAIHKLCTSLNIRYSNDAMSATRTHINTLVERGKNVNAVFGIYRAKLLATQKTMTKSVSVDMTYEDIGVVFTNEEFDIPDIAIPLDVREFWGTDLEDSDILYLENKYIDFQKTHSTNTHTEVELLQQVCFTLLDIKKARQNDASTEKLLKTLQDLMKNLAIAPNIKQQDKGVGDEAFGLWIEDIERSEPAYFLATDPRGDIYRDVSNIQDYYDNYFIRALSNFVGISKDFTIVDEDDGEMSEFDIEQDMFADVEEDDG